MFSWLGDSSSLVSEYCTRPHCTARVGLTSRGKCSTAILLRDLKVQAAGLLVSLVWVTTVTHHIMLTVVLFVSLWGTLKPESNSLPVCPVLLKLCVNIVVRYFQSICTHMLVSGLCCKVFRGCRSQCGQYNDMCFILNIYECMWTEGRRCVYH
jgi:hypothetical protein